MRHGSLFSGIGGFDLAAEWMGWENVFHCEWNKFGQKILKHYWPKAISYDDITKTDFTIHRGNIDILTGGFPCQPFSVIGNRKGVEDERYLFDHMLRSIKEIKPTWVIAENVTGILSMESRILGTKMESDTETCKEVSMVMYDIREGLKEIGYESEYYIIPSCGVGANNKRERVWIVAHSNQDVRNAHKNEPKPYVATKSQRTKPEDWSLFYAFDSRSGKADIPESCECQIFRNDDGISEELDEFEAFGNAINPHVAYEIFNAIKKLNA